MNNNELKQNCCSEQSNKIAEKIIYFLQEKLLNPQQTYNVAFNKIIIDELKKLVKSENLKISQKYKANIISNLSNICEINNETNSSHKNSKNEGNRINMSRNVSDLCYPQKIIVNNIKQIISSNNNSRNHKDIIHEDDDSDLNKYDLNDLNGIEKSLKTESVNNQIIITKSDAQQVQNTNKTDSMHREKEKSNNTRIDKNIISDNNENFNPNKLGIERKSNKIAKSDNLSINKTNQVKKKVKSFSPSLRINKDNILINFNKIRFSTNEEYKKKLKYSYDPTNIKFKESSEIKTIISRVNSNSNSKQKITSKEKVKKYNDHLYTNSPKQNHKSRNNIYNTEWYKNFSRLTAQNKYSILKNIYDKGNITNITSLKETVDNKEIQSGNPNKLKNNIGMSNFNKNLLYHTNVGNSNYFVNKNTMEKVTAKNSFSPEANRKTVDKYNLYKSNAKIINNKSSKFSNISYNNCSSTNNNPINDKKSKSKKGNDSIQNKPNTSKTYINPNNTNYNNHSKNLELKNLEISRNISLNNQIFPGANTTKSTKFETFKNMKITKSKIMDINGNYSNIQSDKMQSNENYLNKRNFMNPIIHKSKEPKNKSQSVSQSNTMIFNNNYFTTFAGNPKEIHKPKIHLDKELNPYIKNQNENFDIDRTEKDIMKEIKKNLDENYKNFFNFSYENYLNKDHSSDSNPDGISIVNESLALK